MEATHHGGMFSVTILGAVMGKSVATMVIEPRSLVREALVSLMTRHSYHIVGNIASTADIAKSSNIAEAPRLVILGALPVDDAASAAVRIRRLWPEAKIILLFDDASSGDFQKVLASEIDGCIPLRASPDTLLDTLREDHCRRSSYPCPEDGDMLVDAMRRDEGRRRASWPWLHMIRYGAMMWRMVSSTALRRFDCLVAFPSVRRRSSSVS